MEVLDICLKLPGINPSTIATKMVFLIMKVLEYLRVMEDVGLVLKIPENLPISIVQFIFMVIVMVIIVEMEIGLKILSNLPLVIVEKSRS